LFNNGILGGKKLKRKNEVTEMSGWLSNGQESDLVKLLQRPHAEFKAATGRDDYCCDHCGAQMMVTEIEFEGNAQLFKSGYRITRGNNEPVFSHMLNIIVYASHRCSAQRDGSIPWSDDCTMLELCYEF
jgi:hypothetical protein